MHVVIFADRPDYQEISPLRGINPAMLPVMGRPVIQHIVESYQQSGAEKIWIVLGEENRRVRKALGAGLRWSIEIEYVYIASQQSYLELINQLGDNIQYPCIASRGDVIYKHWLNELQSQPLSKNIPASIIITDQLDLSINKINWNFIENEINNTITSNISNPKNISERFDFLDYFPLFSLGSFHSLCNYITNQLEKLQIQHGVKKSSFVRLGVNTRFNNRSLQGGSAYIDDYSDIHESAKLKGCCYIGKNCIIDRNAELKNCVVLDNTYVGPEVMIKNAVVVENTIHRVDLATSIEIEDEALLSPIVKAKNSSLVDKLLALLIILITIPVILLIAGYIKYFRKRSPFTTKSILLSTNFFNGLSSSEHTESETPSSPVRIHLINCDSPLFAKLPLFLLVLKGHLRLISSSPLPHLSEAFCENQYCSIAKDVFCFNEPNRQSFIERVLEKFRTLEFRASIEFVMRYVHRFLTELFAKTKLLKKNRLIKKLRRLQT